MGRLGQERQDNVKTVKEFTMNKLQKIIILLIALICGYAVGRIHETKMLEGPAIADNIEKVLYANGYPLSHFPQERIDRMTLGELKFRYKNYYIATRAILENFAVNICYRNITEGWVLEDITIGNLTEPKKDIIMRVIE